MFFSRMRATLNEEPSNIETMAAAEISLHGIFAPVIIPGINPSRGLYKSIYIIFLGNIFKTVLTISHTKKNIDFVLCHLTPFWRLLE